MADPTPEERRKELADAFADGLDTYEARKAERDAAAAAAKGGTNGGSTSGDATPPKSWTERILGI